MSEARVYATDERIRALAPGGEWVWCGAVSPDGEDCCCFGVGHTVNYHLASESDTRWPVNAARAFVGPSEEMVEAAARAMWPASHPGDRGAFDACSDQVRAIYLRTARRGLEAAADAEARPKGRESIPTEGEPT